MKNTQEQRLKFMELLLYWEGSFTKKQIIDQFGITKPQIINDIKKYSEQYHRISMGEIHKIESTQEIFQSELISQNADDYLSWLHSGNISFLTETIQSNFAHQITLPSRNISPNVIQKLVQAIRKQKRLEVDYVSISNPEHDGRILHPHSFAFSGIRWHVRGYCEKHQEFRDFVLTRFKSEPEILDGEAKTTKDDENWNTEVEIILAPDSRLSAERKQVLIDDYQMQEGKLNIKTKAALVNYVIKAMQINTKILDGEAVAQQLIVENISDIKQWLFD